MKLIEYCQCEICKEIYLEESLAKSCEKSHVANTELEITEVKYLPPDCSEYDFPEQVIIERKNYSGCAAIYYRDREGSVEDIYDE